MIQASIKIATSGTVTAEIATVTHNGKNFTALGSVLDSANGIASGYVSTDGKWLTTWQGERIAPLVKVSTWKVRSVFSATMSAYRTTIDGRVYCGRGFGPTTFLRLRARKGSGS